MRPTPYVFVDPDVLDANIRSMQAFCDARGIALRPHAKTHKSLEVARRQLDAGAVGLTVATVGEGEVFADLLADHGKDLLVAYPVAVTPDRLRALASRVTTVVGVDATEGIERAAEAGVAVSIEVDSGLRRSGVAPHDAGRLATAALARDVDVIGVFTFPGHGYRHRQRPRRCRVGRGARPRHGRVRLARRRCCSPGGQRRLHTDGRADPPGRRHRAAARRLRVHGCRSARAGAATPEQVALAIRATVVSDAVPGQVVVDAGAKVLGMDRPGYLDTHGMLPAYPHARLTRVWEHHGVVEIPTGSDRPALGERVDVIPNHVCATVNLVDELVVGEAAWPVAARGRNN